jgi:cell division protein FtsQ|tara:strand:- start:8077 stop:8760 length:684 start_codon:yes stop_codon:yes gene_type:complete
MHQLIDKKNKISVYLILFFLLSTISNKKLQIQSNNFNTNIEVEVHGLSNSANLKIKKKLEALSYKNIFLIDRESVYKVMSKYNLIENYNIKKNYPKTINIQIKPTKFIARVKNNKEFLIGSNGKLISNISVDTTLPILFGKFDSNELLELKKNIDNSKFEFTEFKSIFFFQSMRWDLQTYDDVLIKLPQQNLPNALKTAFQIIKDKQLTKLQVIDLRISNQVIITNE